MINKITNYIPTAMFFTFIIWMITSPDLKTSNFIIDIGHSVPFGDKIGHFALFGILALLLNMSLKFKQVPIKNRLFHLGSLIVFFFAIAEEFSQLAFDNRTFDVIDMLFDLFGIGLLSSIAFRKYLVKQIKFLASYLGTNLQVN